MENSTLRKVNHDDATPGDKVVHVPPHLDKEPEEYAIKRENLGEVISKNLHYIFVRFAGKTWSQAVRADLLYDIRGREDLISILNQIDENNGQI